MSYNYMKQLLNNYKKIRMKILNLEQVIIMMMILNN